MKVHLSYILFFALALRPLYNIGYVAYFELNIDYIVETYCVNKEKPQLQCNGKCHLATQLTTTSDTTEESASLNTIFEVFIPVYFQEHKSISLYKINTLQTLNNWKYSNTFNSVFSDPLDHPPQV